MIHPLRRIFALLCCLLALCCQAQGRARANDLYVINGNGGTTISRITPSGVVSTFVSGLNNAQGLMFDRAGNLYVSVHNDHAIEKITPGGVISTYATGFDLPFAMAFDAAGSLYVTDFFSNAIMKVTPNGTVSTYLSNIDRPGPLRFDSRGALYYGTSNYSGNFYGSVWKVDASGNTSLFAQSNSLYASYDFAFDTQDNLFVATQSSSSLVKITPDGTQNLFGSNRGLRDASGLAFDGQGSLFVSDPIDGQIYKLAPDGSGTLFTRGLEYPLALAFAPTVTPEADGRVLGLAGMTFFAVVFRFGRGRRTANARQSFPGLLL